jgi:hypothetical protein
MSWTIETHRGVVYGASIELEHPLAMPDGSKIEIIVKRQPLTIEERRSRLEALFGCCAADADDLEDFLRLNREQRLLNRSELEP